MLTQALTAPTDIWKENSRILSLLNDKAQKTAGLAGIFLAAAFAFLQKDSLEPLLSSSGQSGLYDLLAEGRAVVQPLIERTPDAYWVLQDNPQVVSFKS